MAESTTIKTNWIVLTGAPSSGKSAVLEELRRLGYRTCPEVARAYIQAALNNGLELAEIRKDEAAFQRELVSVKEAVETSLDPKEPTFMDRAMPDSIAYFRLRGLDPASIMPLCTRFNYYRIFLFESLPMASDPVRTEDAATAAKIEELLRAAYTSLGYQLITVPAFPGPAEESISKRASFVLEQLGVR